MGAMGVMEILQILEQVPVIRRNTWITILAFKIDLIYLSKMSLLQ